MNYSNVNGSAASPENLSLSAVPPANGRRALYLCASSLIRVGQYRQAERVCQDLLAHSARFMDGKNYYAARRLLCTLGSSSDTILGNLDGKPRFLLESDSRVQFDLFCANEELCSSRWDNARIILQSLCTSLENEAGLDEYTSFAFGWFATSIRRTWQLIRNVSGNQRSIRELNSLWAHALENAEIAATHFEWELPLFSRESAWQHVLTSESIDLDFVSKRLLEGASVAQQSGMIREEYECLAAWHEINQFASNSLPNLAEEWQSRWNCLARQFSPERGELNSEDIAFDGLLGELSDLQDTLQQYLSEQNATPQKSLHPQKPALAP